MRKFYVLMAAGLLITAGSPVRAGVADRLEPKQPPVTNQVTGTVTQLQPSGLIALQTGSETLKLYFPPTSIADLKRGDQITADLSFWPQLRSGQAGDVPSDDVETGDKSPGGMSPGRLEAPKAPLQDPVHTINGTVRDIDRANGTFALDSTYGQLKLQFPVNTVEHLKNGDQITVQLAYHKQTESARLPQKD